jgi:type I restriction enzyme R subunit
VRKRLRDLVKFIDPSKRKIIYTDFEDEIGLVQEVEYGPSVTALARYKRKVMHFLQSEENNIVLQKIKRNRALTEQDIKELERIFFESGDIGTREEFEQAFGQQEKLGLFIRSLIGLDRHEAKLEFADFLNGERYTANQIEFVNMIIDYLTKNGVMSPEMLFESPYTDYNSNGLGGMFSDGEAARIVDILKEMRARVAA